MAGVMLACWTWPGAATATDYTAPTYTPSSANNGGAAIQVNSGTDNLNGTMAFTGSTVPAYTAYSLPGGYNAGYITGPVNPNGRVLVTPGSRNVGVNVIDPITMGTTVVTTYDNAGILQQTAGGGWVVRTYQPTPPGGGPFVGAAVANASGGATFNMNAAGNIGDITTRNTTFVTVTNGTVNWNSANRLSFLDASLIPNLASFTQTQAITSFPGNFTVNTTDGPRQRSVNDLAELRQYNTWLVQQLRDGKLGSGAAAQTAYNNAFNQAYTNQNVVYTVNPNNGSIPANDPMLIPAGVRLGLLANGANALVRIGPTGILTSDYNSGSGATLVKATNRGTVVNDGVLASERFVAGVLADAGGRFINNGVRWVGGIDPVRVTEISSDISTGVGSSYVNNGVLNMAVWSYSPTSGYGYQTGLTVSASASAANHGVMNIGTNKPTFVTMPYGVRATGGTFTNGSDGLMYLGRSSQTSPTAPTTLTEQPNGGIVIDVISSSGAINDGDIVIGDRVQNGRAISVTGTGVNVVNNGRITVNGHYGSAPDRNVGIYSTATSGVVDNAGLIDLQGVNTVGVLASGGGRASSSGRIRVASGLDAATGLRSYGIWSEGAGSAVNLSGAVELASSGGIGVHARDGGAVNLSGNAKVDFTGGSNQIGFFAYGSGSTINDNGSGVRDVSTTGSTLFRLEDGADLTASVSAASHLRASGEHSTAVLATGRTGSDPSAFNSGGTTIDLSGARATGVRVEGGAQGKITAAATIDMNDAAAVAAVAAVADGQKFSLDGTAAGTPVAGVLNDASRDAGAAGFGSGTVLASAAHLNSNVDQVTGYVARNQAALEHRGAIDFTGMHGTGIAAQSGATVINSGAIAVGAGGVGIRIDGSGSLATVVTNTGAITARDGSTSDRTVGVLADGGRARAVMNAGTTLNLAGDGAIGAQLRNGATIDVAASALLRFDASHGDQIGFHATGANSTINSAADLDASGLRSAVFRIEDGATLASSTRLAASGTQAVGVMTSGAGARTELNGGVLAVNGQGATGVWVEGGGQAQIGAAVAVSLAGDGAVLGRVDGQKHDLGGMAVGGPDPGTTLTNRAASTLAGNGATGLVAQNSGLLINEAALSMTGAGATAVRLSDGGLLRNRADITVANGTGILMEGASAQLDNGATVTARDGIAALQLRNGAGTAINGSYVSEGGAHAVLLGSGATGLRVDNATLTSRGSGNAIENLAGTGILLADATLIAASGAGIRTPVAIDPASTGLIQAGPSGTGIRMEQADGGTVSGDLAVGSGLRIDAIGAASSGIRANTTGQVMTAATVSVSDPAGDAALWARNASLIANSGTLESASTQAAVIDADGTRGKTVVNSGSVRAATSSQVAIRTGSGDDTVILDSGAVRGVVRTGDGSDRVAVRGGTLEGSIETGNGNGNQVQIQGISLATVVHVTNGSGEHGLLELNSIGARQIGSLGGDDVARATNVGNHWNQLLITGQSDVRLVDALTLSGAGAAIGVGNGATLRIGDGIGTRGGGGTELGALDIVNDGALVFDHAGTRMHGGSISGAGSLTRAAGGTTMLTGANSYAGVTTIDAGGTLQLGDGGNIGSLDGGGAIVDNGLLALNRGGMLTLARSISGTGELAQQGPGTSNLMADSSYSGGTRIENGRLNAGSSMAFGSGRVGISEGAALGFAADGLNLANPIELAGPGTSTIDTAAYMATVSGSIAGQGALTKQGAGTLIMSAPSSYIGATRVEQGTLRADMAGAFSAVSAHSVAPGATLDTAGLNQTLASLTNAGTVSLQGAGVGATLTVNGQYVGQGGVLRLGTVLGDSASASDRLVLDGPVARASGSTTIQIVNRAGLGAMTRGDGIAVVTAANGATTTAQTTRDAFRLQGGHVDAGAFEYRLHAGDAQGAGENWYLRSAVDAPNGVPNTTPPAGGSAPPGAPAMPIAAPPLNPSPAPAPTPVPTYRAEVPLFSALPAQWRELGMVMVGNLHQRAGDQAGPAPGGPESAPDAVDPGAGAGRPPLWARVISFDRRIGQQGTVDPRSRGRTWGFQLGMDLWRDPQWRLGIYLGQLEGQAGVSGFARGIEGLSVGSNDQRGLYLGAYATYRRDSGLYVDSVLQAGRLHASVRPDQASASTHRGSSMLASVELGQSFEVAPRWQVEPQVQLAQQRLSFDDAGIAGATVQQDAKPAWMLRLGVRARGQIATSRGLVQPYARANLYRRSNGTDTTRFVTASASTGIDVAIGGSSAEFALGASWRIRPDMDVYGELGKLWRLAGAAGIGSGINASFGARVAW